MVKIELTNQEAEFFKQFRQYQDDFSILIKAGFFSFKDGQAIVSRDHQGVLKNVEIKQSTFIRRKLDNNN